MAVSLQLRLGTRRVTDLGVLIAEAADVQHFIPQSRASPRLPRRVQRRQQACERICERNAAQRPSWCGTQRDGIDGVTKEAGRISRGGDAMVDESLLCGNLGGDLVGDVDSRVRGVGAACIDVDKDVVSDAPARVHRPSRGRWRSVELRWCSVCRSCWISAQQSHSEPDWVWVYWWQAGHCWAEAVKKAPACLAVGNNTTACWT